MIKICLVALGIVFADHSFAETAMHQVPDHTASLERLIEGPNGLTVLALMLATLVPTFAASQLLLLLMGSNGADLVLAHCASLLITGVAAGTILTEESGFAGIAPLALIAAPQLVWLLIDLIRSRPKPR